MDYHKVILTIVTVLVTASFKPVTTLVPDSELFPYLESHGSSRFLFNDDDFLEVRFTLPFHFFNRTYSSTFISGNGQISFGEGVRTYTPNCSPSTIPMIMAFWADADNRVDAIGARLLYRETTNRALLNKASKDVFLAFPQLQGITLSWMFIVTWKDIPFYGAKDDACKGLAKRNTYQLILTTDGTHSFAILYYNEIKWTTGSSSSGNCHGLEGKSAKAGFDYGDGTTYYTIPGSCTNSILNLPRSSNINQPGKWVFQIDSNLDTATCEKFDEHKQTLRIQPPIVSVMGNTPILVHGPCLEEKANVTCVFRDLSRPSPIETKGGVLPRRSVTVCPVPFLYSLGRIRVDLLVSYPNQLPTLYKGFMYTIQEQEITDIPQVYVNKTADGSLHMTAKWDPGSLRMEEIEKLDRDKTNLKPASGKHVNAVDISVVEYDGKRWRDVGVVVPAVQNNGFFQGPFNNSLVKKFTGKKKPYPRAFVVKGKRELRSGVVLEKQHASSIVRGTELLGAELQSLLTNEVEVDLKDKKPKKPNKFDKLCKQWFDAEPAPPTDVAPCPRTLDQASVDSRFAVDKNPNLHLFNPGAVHGFIQSTPALSGAGSQCTYDSEGRLIIGPPGGGRLHRRSPNSFMDHWAHYWDDVVPFLYCCKWSAFRKKNCRKYFYNKRPWDDGSKYAPPRPTRATGDPHITTFDGLTYTFNGVGEFWMMKWKAGGITTTIDANSASSSFSMQARMEQYVSVEGKPSNASVFTAAVMEQVRNGSRVKVQVAYSSERISVMVDDEPVDIFQEIDFNDDIPSNTTDDDEGGVSSEFNLENGFTLFHNGVTVFLKSAIEVVVSFSNGFSFTFSTAGLNEVALNIIGSASHHLMHQTEGLMGNFDEEVSNDLRTPEGVILPSNLSMQDIHYKFGMHWVVHENDTIFTYPPGKSYSDYFKPNFRPTFLSSEEIAAMPAKIVDFCDGVADCIFDYLTTGSDSIANATRTTLTIFEEVVHVSVQEVKQCDPPFEPENGYISGTSYMVGSAIEVRCEEDYHLFPERINEKFTCVLDDGEQDKPPKWVDARDKDMPHFACLTQEQLVGLELFQPNFLVVTLSVLAAMACLIGVCIIIYCVVRRLSSRNSQIV